MKSISSTVTYILKSSSKLRLNMHYDCFVVLLKCAASSANDVQATIQDLTDSPNKRQLNSEVLLISRMIYRCTNNLGGHKAIQGLQKVCHLAQPGTPPPKQNLQLGYPGTTKSVATPIQGLQNFCKLFTNNLDFVFIVDHLCIKCCLY